MLFDEFMVEFDEAHESCGFGKIDTAAAEVKIERLRTLVPRLESDKDRSDAEFVLNDFADEISPASRDRMGRAAAALNAAMKSEGPVEEQIDRAHQGIRDITSIGLETDNESERYAIISMNSTLGTLISDLKAELQD